jgi:N-acetyl-anhydromuramyl-L-alanine amidase AmpD
MQLGPKFATADPQTQSLLGPLLGAGPVTLGTYNAGFAALWNRLRDLCAWICGRYGIAPTELYGFDDVTWARSGTGVAITVEHAFPWWVLAPRDLERLRAQV